MDTENVFPPNAVTANTRQKTKLHDSSRPLTYSKKGLSVASSKASRTAKTPRTKRRALGDITNRHALPSSSSSPNTSKVIKKPAGSKNKIPLRPVISVHRDNIIPVDDNGSVESEFVPDCPPEPFEPPVFDFVEHPNRSDIQHERETPFYDFDFKDSPVRNIAHPVALRLPELSDSSFEPESCLSVFAERTNLNVNSLFKDDDLPALRLRH